MTANGRRRLKRFALSTALAVTAAIAAGLLLGTTAAVVASVVGFLGVAIASDDDLGTCLPLAVFFLIGLALLMIALVGTILVNT
jgi:O-antigen ligase